MKRMEGGICFKEAVPWDLSPSLPIRTCIHRPGGCPLRWRRRPKAPKEWKVNSRQAAGQRPVPWGWNVAVYSYTPRDSATVLLVFAPWVRVYYYPINTNPTGKLKRSDIPAQPGVLLWQSPKDLAHFWSISSRCEISPPHWEHVKCWTTEVKPGSSPPTNKTQYGTILGKENRQ